MDLFPKGTITLVQYRREEKLGIMHIVENLETPLPSRVGERERENILDIEVPKFLIAFH